MQKIATVSLDSAAAANITFASIPSNFTDLVLVVSARSTGSGTFDQLAIRFNGDSGTTYSNEWVATTGSTATANGGTGQTYIYGGWMPAASSSTSTYGSATIHIGNYGSAVAKACQADSSNETQASTGLTGATAFVNSAWSGTAAINSITITAGSASNLAQYSSATLYGITKGSGGATAA